MQIIHALQHSGTRTRKAVALWITHNAPARGWLLKVEFPTKAGMTARWESGYRGGIAHHQQAMYPFGAQQHLQRPPRRCEPMATAPA